MWIKIFHQLLVVICLFSFFGAVHATEKLPENLKWETNDTAPIFASPHAKKGGTYHSSLTSFPLTLRTVGPDSNGSFAGVLRSIKMALLDLQPNTEEFLPSLATHWALGDDKKTVYFKLDKRARWSDGHPVTADDFVYKLEFMRSPHIVDPWSNNHYTENIDRIVKYDDHTISVSLTKVQPDILFRVNQTPVPKHFYGKLSKDFVKKYNWKIVPNTGPYQIDKIKKGKSITLKRQKNWWAKDLKYYKGRYNIDKISYIIVRDLNTSFEYFKKQRLESFSLILPDYWHEKAKNMELYEKGYVKKIWAYTNDRESPGGFWLNQDKEIFKDRNVRYAFAHAINMDKVLNGLLRGDYSRLHNYNTGYGAYTNPKIRARKFDIKKVEELMTASGWKRGDDGIWEKGKMRYSVRVTYSQDHHTTRLVLLKEEAKKAGIELRLQRLDGSAAFKSYIEKKHDVAWMGWSTSFRPQYWGLFHSVNAHKPQTNNITNTNDPELDKLIDVYRNSTETNERIELSHKIQEKIHEIGAYVPHYKVGYIRAAYWRWIQFPEVPGTKSSLLDPLGIGISWIDEDIKKETELAMKTGKTFKPETIMNKTFKVD